MLKDTEIEQVRPFPGLALVRFREILSVGVRQDSLRGKGESSYPSLVPSVPISAPSALHPFPRVAY